jgi:hypothetical protein
MTSYLGYYYTQAVDKLGDATLVVLDEMKFWGEVITEFMEYDQSSSDKFLDDYR